MRSLDLSLGRGLDKCVKCSICVEYCPVYRVDERFPGPKQCGPDSQRFRHHREAWDESWLDACSHCTLCETACPSGVPIASMILHAHNRHLAQQGRKPVHYLLSSPSTLGKLARLAPPLVNMLMQLSPVRILFEKVMGIDRRLPFPRYSRQRVRGSALPGASKGRQVLFFHGCTVGYNQPEIGKVLVKLLKRLDVEVLVPPQDCCGLPKLCNGDLSGARTLANEQMRAFSQVEYATLPILYTCTSCGHALANEWAHLSDDEALSRAFSERVYNIHEYVLELLQGHSLPMQSSKRKVRIAYHIPCHLRSLGIGLPGVSILRKLPNVQVQVLNSGCCGLSGTYGYKPDHGEKSRHIGEEVAKAVRECNPDLLVSDCGSCRLQLHSLTGLPALDPLELLDQLLTWS